MVESDFAGDPEQGNEGREEEKYGEVEIELTDSSSSSVGYQRDDDIEVEIKLDSVEVVEPELRRQISMVELP